MKSKHDKTKHIYIYIYTYQYLNIEKLATIYMY